MPIIAYNYKTISLTFFITNILTSYIIGLIIIFGFVLILVSFVNIDIAILFGNIYKILINLLLIIVSGTSKIPFSKVYIKTPYLWQIVLYYVIVFYIFFYVRKNGKKKFFDLIKKFLYYIRKQYKKVVIVIIIVSLLFFSLKLRTQDLKIYFIDVGQGDCCLIVTKEGKKILIDGGGSENYDIGEKVLIPYLLNRRIDSLDYIMFSHFDTDYSMTYPKIAKNIDILSF